MNTPLPLFAETHAEAAERWMDDHPEAYALFVRLAKDAAARGHRFGIGQLAEIVRWEYAVNRDGEEFKVNNNYRAYIARRMVEENEELRGFIEMRKVRA